MTVVVLVASTLIGQRLLGLPGLPGWATGLWLPLIWIVWPPLRNDRPWPLWALVGLGLGWDLVSEPVIGPGGIAWSGAGVAIAWAARRMADRSPLAWAVAGGAGAALVTVLRRAALLPLGVAGPWLWPPFLETVVLGIVWCGLVGTVQRFDIAGAIQRVRRSRLR